MDKKLYALKRVGLILSFSGPLKCVLRHLHHLLVQRSSRNVFFEQLFLGMSEANRNTSGRTEGWPSRSATR